MKTFWITWILLLCLGMQAAAETLEFRARYYLLTSEGDAAVGVTVCGDPEGISLAIPLDGSDAGLWTGRIGRSDFMRANGDSFRGRLDSVMESENGCLFKEETKLLTDGETMSLQILDFVERPVPISSSEGQKQSEERTLPFGFRIALTRSEKVDLRNTLQSYYESGMPSVYSILTRVQIHWYHDGPEYPSLGLDVHKQGVGIQVGHFMRSENVMPGLDEVLKLPDSQLGPELRKIKEVFPEAAALRIVVHVEESGG